MNLLFPQNIFTNLLFNSLPEDLKSSVTFLPSSIIAKTVKEKENSIGLIPTTDLINYKDFFVSKSVGISFEESLCNSYLYFGKDEVSTINLYGDISSIEVILTKILFKEQYNTDVNLQILRDGSSIKDNNLLLIGDNNFKEDKFKSGVSFAEEVIEILSLPFVNNIFASNDPALIEQLNSKAAGISQKIYDLAEEKNFGANISGEAKEYIRNNISSLIVKFDVNDLDGIKQLTRLPYFHGMIKDIIEIKFV